MSTENQTPEEEPQKGAADAQTEADASTQASVDDANADLQDTAETEAAEQPNAEGDAEAETEASEEPSVEQALAAAKAEAQEFKDRFLRSEAELENVRKRSEREIVKARKFALEKFAGDLLSVLDSLDMGQQAAQQEGASLESVREGAELTLKMFIDTLGKHGVEQLDPTGEKFDPEEHEAMVMQPSADAEPNTVLDTFQKGYKLNDRVLRPARVVVAKAAD